MANNKENAVFLIYQVLYKNMNLDTRNAEIEMWEKETDTGSWRIVYNQHLLSLSDT